MFYYNNRNTLTKAHNISFEIKGHQISNLSSEVLFDIIRKIGKGQIKINNEEENNINIDIKIEMTEKSFIEFRIIVVNGREFFEYIPIEIQYKFEKREDEIFFKELEIPIIDLPLLIDKFISLRNNTNR